MATAALDTGRDQPPGLPNAPISDKATLDVDKLPSRVPDSPKQAHASRTVLLLFLGPFQRPDGISAFLKQAGLDVDMIDNHPEHGGGANDMTFFET
eukprot:1245929-Pleurochrysis_carterae.AAC.5